MVREKLAMLGMVAVLGFSVVACGGDDDDSADEGKDETSESGDDGGGGDGQAYVDAIMETSEGDETLSEDQNRCFAEAVVAGLGVEAFEAAGVTPDDIRENPDDSPTDLGLEFSEEQADGFWDAANTCVDVRELFLESMSQGQELTDAQKTCLGEGLDEEFIKTMFLASFTEDTQSFDEETTAKLTEVMSTCGAAG